MNRAALGGHSASERKLRDIYQNSMNLLTAFEENRQQRIALLRIFDNSENFGRPRLVLSMFRGVPRSMAAKRSCMA
jgi:predicted ABC-type ATPase